MTQARGLDPTARQITGAANTILTGVNNIQQMQNRQRKQEFQQEKRERQRQQWETKDDADQMYVEAFNYLRQNRNTSEDDTSQQQKRTMIGPGEDNIPEPVARGLDLKWSQQGPLQTDKNTEIEQLVSRPGGLQTSSQQQQSQEQPGLSSDEPLAYVRSDLKRIEEFFNQLDKEKHEPAAVRAAKTRAISDVVDILKANSQYKKIKAQNLDLQRQQLITPAISTLQSYEKGDPESAKQLADIYTKLPNGKIAEYDEQENTVKFWSESQPQTSENAKTIAVDQISAQDARDYIMSSLQPKTYLKNSLANEKAVREFNRKNMTDPYVFERENGEMMYGAPVVDRRGDHKVHWQFWSDPYLQNSINPQKSDINISKRLGKASEMTDEWGQPFELGKGIGQFGPKGELQVKEIPGSNKNMVNISGVNMERDQAMEELNDQLDFLANVDTQNTQNINYNQLTNHNTSEKKKKSILNKIINLSNSKKAKKEVREAANEVLQYRNALWGDQASGKLWKEHVPPEDGGNFFGLNTNSFSSEKYGQSNKGNEFGLSLMPSSKEKTNNTSSTKKSNKTQSASPGKEGSATKQIIQHPDEFKPNFNSTNKNSKNTNTIQGKAAKNMYSAFEDSPLTAPKRAGEQILKQIVLMDTNLNKEMYYDPIKMAGSTAISLLKDFKKWSQSRYDNNTSKSTEEKVKEYANKHPETMKRIEKNATNATK